MWYRARHLTKGHICHEPCYPCKTLGLCFLPWETVRFLSEELNSGRREAKSAKSWCMNPSNLISRQSLRFTNAAHNFSWRFNCKAIQFISHSFFFFLFKANKSLKLIQVINFRNGRHFIKYGSLSALCCVQSTLYSSLITQGRRPFMSAAAVNDSNSWKSVQMWDFVTVDNVTDS